jgi:hypothetical protein
VGALTFVRGAVTERDVDAWYGPATRARLVLDTGAVVVCLGALAEVVRVLLWRRRRVRIWARRDGADLVAVSLRITGRPGEVFTGEVARCENSGARGIGSSALTSCEGTRPTLSAECYRTMR